MPSTHLLPLLAFVSVLSAPLSSSVVPPTAVVCVPHSHVAAVPAVAYEGPLSVPCLPAEVSKNPVVMLTLQVGLGWSFIRKKSMSFNRHICTYRMEDTDISAV